ncbi:MAG: ABC transporter permease [Bacilli bacterium]|nr:ABC transporter permease [Bacilli bacterium]
MNSYQKALRINKRKVLLTQIILFVLFVLLWELLSQIGLINDFLFSSPSKIIKLLISYFKSNEIYKHIMISLFETIIGLIIGTVFGILFGIVFWWNKFLSKVFDPFLVVLNALPKTALAPILIIWAGTGVFGIIVVSVSISLILTIISSYNYFKNIDEEKILMLKSFGANRLQILFKLVIPYNIPNLINLIKINIGMTWVGVIVGEFLVSRMGIGYLIMYGSQVFKMDLVMMGVIILAVIAFIMYEIVNIIEKKIRKNRGI